MSQDLTYAPWRKSTRSGGGNDCVEVAPLLDGSIAVRHSKRPEVDPLIYTRSEWVAFIGGVKDGEFDFAD